MTRPFVPPPPPRRGGRPTSGPSNDYYSNSNQNRYGNMEDIDEDDDINDDNNDIDSILAMAKRLDDASVISDPSFICGPEPHLGGLDPPDGRGGGRNQNQYRPDSDLYSIASNDDSRGVYEEDSVYTDGSGSNYTGARSDVPMMGPRVGHHGDSSGPRVGHYGGGSANRNSHARYSSGVGYNSKVNGGRYNNSPYNMSGRDGNGSKGISPPRGGRHNGDFVDSQGPRGGRKGKDVNDDDGESRNDNRSSRLRKAKMIALPIIIILVIASAVGVVVVTGRGGDDDENTASVSEENVIQVSLPTMSPTFKGLYFCPDEYIGRMATRGCLGYVNCNLGVVEGATIMCPKGTLYDMQLNTCDFDDEVECSTKSYESSVDNGDRYDSLPPTSKPTIPTMKQPETSAPPPSANPQPYYPLIGPISTYSHQLIFEGISSLGDMSKFEQDFENYLNLFYMGTGTHSIEGDDFQGVLDLSAENDDVLKRLVEVNIDVNVITFAASRRLRDTTYKGPDSSASSTRTYIRGEQRQLQDISAIIMTYDQTTQYRTAAPPVPLKTILRHPFEPEYSQAFIQYLKSTDQAFSTLQDVEFVEDDSNEQQTAPPIASPTALPTKLQTPPPTKSQTSSPTTSQPVASPVEEPNNTSHPTFTLPPISSAPVTSAPVTSPPVTSAPVTSAPVSSAPTNTPAKPTRAPTKQPTTDAPTPGIIPEFPEYATIQGFMWIDDNKDGLWEKSETPAQGTFVNLRMCEGDKWMATTTSNVVGQFQFLGISEGEYYLEFFKPSLDYEFTAQGVGTTDSTIDSDADGDSGKSQCMTVSPDFSQLTNAGFVEVSDEATPAPAPQ